MNGSPEALDELTVLVCACRLLQAANSGADDDVSMALAALREAAVSASAATGPWSCGRSDGETEKGVDPRCCFSWNLLGHTFGSRLSPFVRGPRCVV